LGIYPVQNARQMFPRRSDGNEKSRNKPPGDPWGLSLAAFTPRRQILGGADDLLLRVVVGRGGIFVHIQPGEALGPLPVALIGGVRQTEEVEIDVALGLVELIAAPLVLVEHRAQAGQLAGDGIPLALAQGKQMIPPAQQIEEPVE